ncbi:MAG: hypothetical protein IJ736_09000, partial [Firmicutes bacterium]|nr:hypothetical protein [Bacillota bacterium]
MSSLNDELSAYLSKNITEKYKGKCELFKKSLDFSEKDISGLDHNSLLETEESVKENLHYIENSDFPLVFGEATIKLSIKQWYEMNMQEYRKKKAKAEKKRDKLKDEILDNIELKKQDTLKAYEAAVLEYKDKLNDIYRPIYVVRKKADEIERFAADLGIDLSFYSIDFQNMSLKEIKETAIVADAALKETLQGRKGFSSLLIFLYLPLYIEPFEEVKYNTAFMAFYMLLMCLVIYAANPVSVGLISLLVIIQSVGNLAVNIKNRKLISAAYSISSNFSSFDKRITDLLSKEPEIQKITAKYEEICNEDIEELLKNELADINAEIEDIVSKSPEDELKAIREEAERYSVLSLLMDEMKKIRDKYTDEFKNNVSAYRKYYEKIKAEVDKRSKAVYPPGIPVNSNYYMDFEFKSSETSSSDGTVIGYNSIKLPFKNILFRYKNEKERVERIKTLKLILSSMLGNVRENFLEVTIVDTEQLGRSMPEFLTKSMKGIIKLVTSEWDKVFKALFDIARENMLAVGTGNFNDYNKKNAIEGKTTLEYRIVIILSTDKALWNDKVFLKFKDYSTDMGIWIWLVHGEEKLYLKDNKSPDGLKDLLNFPVIISSDAYYSYKGEKIRFCEESRFCKPIVYEEKIGRRSVENLAETIKSGRADIVDYEKDYRLRHIPDDKIWSFSTLDGIELHFGFLNGDRADPHIEWLGSDGAKPVHCLMAGETGAGKSATINQVLANLLYMYPPEELELVMVDFKNVEFNMYTGDLLIPHAKLIAGTTDGEYALSVVEYLLKEMRRRQAEFGRYKFQNIMDWNKAVLSGKIKEKYMPRILFLCDEFQVLFTEVDEKIVDKIKVYITSVSKLARFAGCHLWFTSQSMKGTMSADILDQFTLRAALRSSYETSVDILGNDAAFKKLRGRG